MRRKRTPRMSPRHSANGWRSGCSLKLPDAMSDLSRFASRAALGSSVSDSRRPSHTSAWGGALPHVRGIYPPADHFSVFVLRYNFAIEL